MRGALRRDAVDGLKPRANALERLVDLQVLLFGQQRVEQQRLGVLESHHVLLRFAQLGQRAVALQPLFGQHAMRTVAQQHILVAASHRVEQLGQRRGDAVKVDGGLQVEPVDARLHLQLERAGVAKLASFGFHTPAGVQQLPDQVGQGAGREPDNVRGVGEESDGW